MDDICFAWKKWKEMEGNETKIYENKKKWKEMTGNDRKSKEMEGVGTQMTGKRKEKKRTRKNTEEKRHEMEGNWKEITGKIGNERKMEKKTGKKENKRKMKGNESKMPFHLIFFTISCIRLAPGAPRAGRADDKLSRGNDRKWKEMTRNEIGKEMKGKSNIMKRK